MGPQQFVNLTELRNYISYKAEVACILGICSGKEGAIWEYTYGNLLRVRG